MILLICGTKTIYQVNPAAEKFFITKLYSLYCDNTPNFNLIYNLVKCFTISKGGAVAEFGRLYWVVWVVWALWSLSTVRAAKFEIAWPNRDYIG